MSAIRQILLGLVLAAAGFGLLHWVVGVSLP